MSRRDRNPHHHHQPSQQRQQQLRVVLFATGRGDAPSTYRPNRDQTQWWCRRDALVRCVAAFLFGPAPPSQTPSTTAPADAATAAATTTRELIVLFDEDWSRIHMTYSPPHSKKELQQSVVGVVPTEKTVLALWKRCCGDRTAIGHTFRDGGLSARMVLPTVPNNNTGEERSIGRPSASSQLPPAPPPPSSMENKREILEFLQGTCPMDFLRSHRLNGPLELILRKANKKALVRVLREWQTQTQTDHHATKPEANADAAKDQEEESPPSQPLLEEILHQILLQPQQLGDDDDGDDASRRCQIIAATLHESSANELPCWNLAEEELSQQQRTCGTTRICLFLGAVRDMDATERRCLRRACSHATTNSNNNKNHNNDDGVPLLQIRLGPVAEFTSKILAAVAFHQSRNALLPAVLRLLQQQQQQRDNDDSTISGAKKRGVSSAKDGTATADHERNAVVPCVVVTKTPSSAIPPLLHCVCFVPIASHQVTTDLERRNRTLWCLARCTVASLWRSRVVVSSSTSTSEKGTAAGGGGDDNTGSSNSNNNSPLVNRLTLVFVDGVLLTLNQNDVVNSMAEQHQAAPTEYQILKLLEDKLTAATTTITTTTTERAGRLTCTSNDTAGRSDGIIDADNVLDSLLFDKERQHLIALNVVQGGKDPLVTSIYSHKSDATTTSTAATDGHTIIKPTTAVVLLPIIEGTSGEDSSFESAAQQLRKFAKTLHKKQIPVISASIVDSCQDQEAATITILQHFCYQKRLFPALNRQQLLLADPNSKKNRRHHRRGTKERKRKRQTAALI